MLKLCVQHLLLLIALPGGLDSPTLLPLLPMACIASLVGKLEKPSYFLGKHSTFLAPPIPSGLIATFILHPQLQTMAFRTPPPLQGIRSCPTWPGLSSFLDHWHKASRLPYSCFCSTWKISTMWMMLVCGMVKMQSVPLAPSLQLAVCIFVGKHPLRRLFPIRVSESVLFSGILFSSQLYNRLYCHRWEPCSLGDAPIVSGQSLCVPFNGPTHPQLQMLCLHTPCPSFKYIYFLDQLLLSLLSAPWFASSCFSPSKMQR